MRRVLAGSLLALAAVAACNSDQAATVRNFTYAREFRYYDEQEVRGAMQRMSVAVRQLDALLKTDGAPPETQQQEVVRLLTEGDAAARALRSPQRASNHPRLTENLDAFLAEVELARASAQRTPPNYYAAGSITGSCLHCHAPASAR